MNIFQNPNGCPIHGTFYVSHQYTNYAMVQKLWNQVRTKASKWACSCLLYVVYIKNVSSSTNHQIRNLIKWSLTSKVIEGNIRQIMLFRGFVILWFTWSNIYIRILFPFHSRFCISGFLKFNTYFSLLGPWNSSSQYHTQRTWRMVEQERHHGGLVWWDGWAG